LRRCTRLGDARVPRGRDLAGGWPRWSSPWRGGVRGRKCTGVGGKTSFAVRATSVQARAARQTARADRIRRVCLGHRKKSIPKIIDARRWPPARREGYQRVRLPAAYATKQSPSQMRPRVRSLTRNGPKKRPQNIWIWHSRAIAESAPGGASGAVGASGDVFSKFFLCRRNFFFAVLVISKLSKNEKCQTDFWESTRHPRSGPGAHTCPKK
jgi:hypothetical protein